MSAGDRYTAKKLKAARAETRDPTRFDQQDAVPTGWHETAIATQGSKAGMLETVMKELMRRPSQIDRPDEPYSSMPTQPICSTALPPRGRR